MAAPPATIAALSAPVAPDQIGPASAVAVSIAAFLSLGSSAALEATVLTPPTMGSTASSFLASLRGTSGASAGA